MEDTNNYRGTGKSKAELQAEVDVVIARFKAENPGKEVPSSLVNWVDNIATDDDVETARERAAKRWGYW